MKVNVLLILFTLLACQPVKQEKSSGNRSASQPADGWKSLFDGNTLNGWKIFKDKKNNSWEVSDGSLHCKPFSDTETNHRSDLITEEQYENFELTFQFKIASQSNSGIMFRVSEDYDQAYATGPEYQIIDDEGYPGQLAPENTSAGNYAMHVAENKILKPVGEWNEGKIVTNGNHIEHWLNGNKVLEYELFSDDWMARKDASKWKDFPDYATVKKGHIALQDHGNEVWFKNIMIKVLN